MTAVPPTPIVRLCGWLVITGAHGLVVNVASAPVAVPPRFVATARKWYTVLQASPETLAGGIGTIEDPEPTLEGGVDRP
jgi:hypothetical protein